MRFLPDASLYRRVDHCLSYLRQLSPPVGQPSPPPERFHFYWFGNFTAKQAFAVKSLLATQDPRSELWLWLDADSGFAGHEDNPWLRPLLPHIQVRKYDPAAAAEGTPLAGRGDLQRPPKLALRADCFRFVTLYRHGGTYIDIDTMLVRDFGTLLACFDEEFCYRWSAHMPFANSAVLRLQKQSATALRLLERCAAQNSCHPKHVLSFDDQEDLDLLVLPCPFFDPLWPHNDGKDVSRAAPFDKFAQFFHPFDSRYRQRPEIRGVRDFFAGAFAYHWHNGWKEPEAIASYYGLFNREFDKRLAGRWAAA
jgi:hypothetical protein